MRGKEITCDHKGFKYKSIISQKRLYSWDICDYHSSFYVGWFGNVIDSLSGCVIISTSSVCVYSYRHFNWMQIKMTKMETKKSDSSNVTFEMYEKLSTFFVIPIFIINSFKRFDTAFKMSRSHAKQCGGTRKIKQPLTLKWRCRLKLKSKLNKTKKGFGQNCNTTTFYRIAFAFMLICDRLSP